MRQPSGFQVPKLLWSLGMLGASQSTLMKRLCLEATSVVCSSTSCVKKEGISSTVLYICLLKIHFYKYLQLYIHPHIIQSIPRSIYISISSRIISCMSLTVLFTVSCTGPAPAAILVHGRAFTQCLGCGCCRAGWAWLLESDPGSTWLTGHWYGSIGPNGVRNLKRT